MIRFAPYIEIYGLDDFLLKEDVIWVFSKNLKGVSRVNNRFNIELVDDLKEEGTYLDGSIKSIRKFFDKDSFFKLDSVENKKLVVLNLIRDSFLEVSAELKWNKSHILKAYDLSLEEQIQFNYSSKPKLNSTKKIKGFVELKKILQKVQIWGVLEQNNNKHRVLMLETSSANVAFFRMFSQPKWMSEDQFGFEFNNSYYLTISLENKQPNWISPEIEDGLNLIEFLSYQDKS